MLYRTCRSVFWVETCRRLWAMIIMPRRRRGRYLGLNALVTRQSWLEAEISSNFRLSTSNLVINLSMLPRSTSFFDQVQAYLCTQSLWKAERWCWMSTKECRRALRKMHPLYISSLKLTAFMDELKGTQLMLPPFMTSPQRSKPEVPK